jgi:hypothetical protein
VRNEGSAASEPATLPVDEAVVFGVLTPGERAAVLDELLAECPELRARAEQAARRLLASVAAEEIAAEVSSELADLELGDLAARAGRVPGRGYVHETEAAWELVSEVVESFVADVRRRARAGLLDAAAAVAVGIVAGLYDVRDPEDGSVLAYAGPDAPGELADEVLGGGSSRRRDPRRRARTVVAAMDRSPLIAPRAAADDQVREVAALRDENARLRELLGLDARPSDGHERAWAPTLLIEQSRGPAIDATASDVEKVALVRSLFGSRSDVNAVRWDNPSTGKSGWSPAARGGWAKRRSARDLLPLTDEVLLAHLNGAATVGIYPLLPGDSCTLLACDFDRGTWALDALAYLDACHANGVRAVARTCGCSSTARSRHHRRGRWERRCSARR